MALRGLGLPGASGDGRQDLDLERAAEDPEAAQGPDVVRVVEDHRHDREASGDGQVDEAGLQGEQAPVEAARALRHDPDAEAVLLHQLAHLVERGDGLGVLAAIDAQVAREKVSPAEEGDLGDLFLHHATAADGAEPDGEERVERRGVVGDVDGRKAAAEALFVEDLQPGAREPDHDAADEFPVVVPELDPGDARREQQEREGEADGGRRCQHQEPDQDAQERRDPGHRATVGGARWPCKPEIGGRCCSRGSRRRARDPGRRRPRSWTIVG